MPTYVYACQGCREVIERRQSFSDDPLSVCEECGGELRRVIQPVGIIFNRSAPPVSEHEPAAVSATPVETKGESPSADPSSTEAAPTADIPAPATAASAPAKDASPTKETPAEDARAKGAPAKEPAPAAKEAPAPAEPPRPADDGHKPAQRGSRWTTFIR